MSLKLGAPYLVGSGQPGQRENLPKIFVFPFYNADSRGEPYKYIRISLKTDMPIEEVVKIFEAELERMKKGEFETPKTE